MIRRIKNVLVWLTTPMNELVGYSAPNKRESTRIWYRVNHWNAIPDEGWRGRKKEREAIRKLWDEKKKVAGI